MSWTAEEVTRSRKLLLEAIDAGIEISTEGRGVISAMIMDRNRVARLLNLPTRNFKERKLNEGQPTDDAHLV